MIQNILFHSEASELADTVVLEFGVFVLLIINLENPAYFLCCAGHSYIEFPN